MPEIFDRIAENGGWSPCDFDGRVEDDESQGHNKREYEKIWQSCMGSFLQPAIAITEAMNEGLEHVGHQLEIKKMSSKKSHFKWLSGIRTSRSADVESDGDRIKPGDSRFSRVLEKKLEDFLSSKKDYLDAWANSRGLTGEQLQRMQTLDELDEDRGKASFNGHIPRDRQQLYLLLYMQHMVSEKVEYQKYGFRILTRMYSSIPPVLQCLHYPNSQMTLLPQESCRTADLLCLPFVF